VNGSIDLPLAAVAALAVGFAAFVMPDGILSRIIEGSGLPSILSAAQPPLGTTARAGVAAVAALATFGTVFMLLRMLGGSAGKPPKRERGREPERDGAPLFEVHEVHDSSIPRLRRADIHPDAPARRPILAARELGEPDLRPRAPAPVEAEEPQPEPEPEVVEIVEMEDVVQAEDAAPVLDELELSGADIEMIAPEPEAVEAPAAPRAPIEAAPAASEPAADATIADLMARLERGLARRVHRTAAPETHEQVWAPEPEPRPVFQPAGDDRLRSAIENLQKMAARAG
jgi:hypothetical protein